MGKRRDEKEEEVRKEKEEGFLSNSRCGLAA